MRTRSVLKGREDASAASAAVLRRLARLWICLTSHDEDFLAAVKATGRKKLIMTALWTEACLSFATLDALREGYEVYPVVDAVGGSSTEAHQAALERMVQAGARPIGWMQLICELQRDWTRTETAKQFAEILFAVEGQ